MRSLAVTVAILVLSVTVWAKKDNFSSTAKVVSSGVETVPQTGGVTKVDTPPALRQQFPNAPASSTKRVAPESYIETKAEIGDRIYTLRGGTLIEPGEYPASIDGRTVRLLTKDKHDKPKILKLYVLSVAAKP
jgi:hypothetical protein